MTYVHLYFIKIEHPPDFWTDIMVNGIQMPVKPDTTYSYSIPYLCQNSYSAFGLCNTAQKCQKWYEKRNTGKIFHLIGGEVIGYNQRDSRLLAQKCAYASIIQSQLSSPNTLIDLSLPTNDLWHTARHFRISLRLLEDVLDKEMQPQSCPAANRSLW